VSLHSSTAGPQTSTRNDSIRFDSFDSQNPFSEYNLALHVEMASFLPTDKLVFLDIDISESHEKYLRAAEFVEATDLRYNFSNKDILQLGTDHFHLLDSTITLTSFLIDIFCSHCMSMF
jgi:hypothetical protein